MPMDRFRLTNFLPQARKKIPGQSSVISLQQQQFGGQNPMMDLMSKADSDGDGALSLDEFSAAKPDDVSSDQSDAMFGEMDADGNGEVTQDEMKTFAESHGPGQAAGAGQMPPPPPLDDDSSGSSLPTFWQVSPRLRHRTRAAPTPWPTCSIRHPARMIHQATARRISPSSSTSIFRRCCPTMAIRPNPRQAASASQPDLTALSCKRGGRPTGLPPFSLSAN